MRLVILGATGGIGRIVVQQAVKAGHEVTAVVRDPSALDVPGADVRRADALDPAELTPIVAGAGAVVSALGVRPPVKGPVSLLSSGATSALKAMEAVGVRRYLMVSAAGAFPEPVDGPLTRYAVKPLLNRFLRHSFDDTRDAETIIRASTVDWTIARPPRLLDKPRTGRYRVGGERGLKGALNISRADVADFLLRSIEDRSTYRRAIVIAR
ncbi:NAD(P)-dependent oxidoreductase [Phytomonospora endophytica]|uniref:Putative NADH-flavin reductase n=1 Tax=Phytomonospora endophytica TaxID=714109 RepID=A0A841FCV7_9ACTN|nr:NAD(P)H-binding protein [Phytomonospora endophytica]MBB6034106.1 putative NADH-flavin reductase [Phytomonospora endophytica]GIG66500.1 NADH-flavin reductase [Phytomonospora endophytica]